LKIGQIVSSEKRNYKIEQKLGKGGFGQVYKVHVVDDYDKKYAMKVEWPNPDPTMNRLKVEITTFAEVEKAPSTVNKTHFVKQVDLGELTIAFYNAARVPITIFKERRSISCTSSWMPSSAIKIGRQTLEAIAALHECGWLHRDIKPENFAVGRPPKDNVIFMLDFGITKNYLDEK
ncbi:hypothetical protein PFISCL1PPCAC_13267, partial [Pristionchus fissidentatus]